MKIVMLGGGGHCRSCLDVIRDAGMEIAGIVAPAPAPEIAGVPWLGEDTWITQPEASRFRYLVAVGQINNSNLRKKLFLSLQSCNLDCATVVSRRAVASPNSSIGKGCIVMHRAVVNSGAKIGENCIVNTGAIIEHDSQISSHCHISTGAIINGSAHVGEGCMIGSGAILLQGVKVAANSVVGAGAVVTKDIDTPGTWLGIPARRQR